MASLRVVGAVALLALPARAQSDVAAEPAPPPKASGVVEVVVVGTVAEFELLRSVIGPQDFGGAQARWVRTEHVRRDDLLGRRPAESEVVVRCFVRVAPGRANLYFANRTAERFLVREVPLPDGLDPAGREAVGQVLSLSVGALIDDAQTGLTRSETERLLDAAPPPPKPAPKAAPKPAPPKPARPTSSLAAAPYYAAKLYSSEVAIVHGPGFLVGWATDSPELLRSFWLSADYEVPERVHHGDVGVAWETTGFRAGFELLRRLSGGGLLLGGRLGAGVEVVRFSPKSGTASASVALTEARTTTVPVLTPAFELSVPLLTRLSVGLDAFVDLYPVRLSYALALPSGSQEVFAPYQVRPGLALRITLR